MYELSGEHGAKAFHDSIESLREGNRFASSVYVYPEDEYRDMRLFVTDDGRCGFALHDDEVVSVFSRKDSAYPGSAAALLATAVDQGGRRLDCFDTVLPHIYADAGFMPVSRVNWDDDEAPPDWDKTTYAKFNGGEPDIVFMVHQPGSEGSAYRPQDGVRVADYGHGSEIAQHIAQATYGTERTT